MDNWRGENLFSMDCNETKNWKEMRQEMSETYFLNKSYKMKERSELPC